LNNLIKNTFSKYALIIANTDYQDRGLAKLTAPGKDAQDFARILRDPQFTAFDDVQVLLNERDDKIRRAIARFMSGRKPEDLLLLYFSGHGIRDEQGRLFLATYDTEIDILEATGVPAEFVTNAINGSRSKRQLLILDCCNSGAFSHGTKSSSAVGRSMGTARAFEGNGYGRIVLTATDATQFAWEGDKIIGDTQNSVFTHFLIEGLKGKADRDGDGKITIDDLYDYAYEQVVRHTPKQTPGKWSYKQQGEIILRENIMSREAKRMFLPDDTLELISSPNPDSRKLGIQELTGFFNGKHLGLQRAAEQKLREIASNDNNLNLRKMASGILLPSGVNEKQSNISLENKTIQTKHETSTLESISTKRVKTFTYAVVSGIAITTLICITFSVVYLLNIFVSGTLTESTNPTTPSNIVSSAPTELQISPSNTVASPTLLSVPTTVNLALGKDGDSSSVETFHYVSRAFDGDTTTAWSSEFKDNQWMYVDLGSIYTIQEVRIVWERAFGREYTIDISTNGILWNTVYTETKGSPDVAVIPISSKGRYVRMSGIERGTIWGFSILEFEVYGVQ
jgi:uncharacterized protein YciU (UPF0263 family)